MLGARSTNSVRAICGARRPPLRGRTLGSRTVRDWLTESRLPRSDGHWKRSQGEAVPFLVAKAEMLGAEMAPTLLKIPSHNLRSSRCDLRVREPVSGVYSQPTDVAARLPLQTRSNLRTKD
jgi:hypothetical protein